MKDKKAVNKVTTPEDLNKSLKSTHPITWVVLTSVLLCLVAFFVWSILAEIEYIIKGTATLVGGEATLNIEEKNLSKLKVGQKVVISSKEGKIEEINEDGYPIISNFELNDGDYEYYIVIKTIKPIDYFKQS